jgi:hypothetical protein
MPTARHAIANSLRYDGRKSEPPKASHSKLSLNYGKIQKIIFVHQNESKKKINGSITAVLNKYGRLGWELVAIRHEYLQEPPNNNLSDSGKIKYYRQTVYSLKKSLYVDANTISDFGEKLEAAFDSEPQEKSFDDFTEIEDLRFTSIDELNLSTQAKRLLKRVGIETIGNFYDRKDDLCTMGMGSAAEKAATEVTEELYKVFNILITFRTSR